MQSFLEKTVDHLHAKYGDNISNLCIVLPNRRAGLFLKTYFAKKLNKTFFTPTIFATEDFVALLSELQNADTTTLLFELYETVKECNKKNTETFDEFSKWGQILLNDFNEIDRYLVDYKQLFGNLKDIKELESWTLNAEGLTDFQKQYLDFWQLLGTYYENFKARLLKKHHAYQGLAYRIVADDVEEKAKKHHFEKIIFAGFNALNKAEEIIIEKLLDSNKAEIIWDTDNYYVNNPIQEAGKFYRKHDASGRFKKRAENNIVIAEDLLSTEEKNINVIGAAKNIAQTKVAGNIITDIQATTNNLQKTALVLADENLLFPVLHSLPKDLQDINVTMGYPLRNTPIAGYFELVFNLHENAKAIQKGKTNYSFYHSDIIKLLAHPYTNIALYSKENSLSAKPIIDIIQKKNIVFASHTTIIKHLDENQLQAWEIIKPIFNHWNEPIDAINCMNYVVEILKNGIIAQHEKNAENKTSLELEYLFAYTKISKRIQSLMVDYNHSIDSIKTLRGIINLIVRSTTLPFYGEPLMGLQVMGMLETRTLDFENVILLSCNEDILPSAKTVNSFIPFELKRYFGLPTYSDKDAIFSYHFYRLLQRAKNIYLLYNTESDALGGGEKSRFVTQLLYEIPKINPNVTITEQLVNIPIISENSNEITILKTPEIMERLNGMADYGISPSTLNRYRNCSLQFYFHAIAKLKEVDEVEETIGADTLGNVIHEALERLYTPFVGKNIKEENIKAMQPQVEAVTIECFEKHYNKSELSFGKNLLTYKVAIKFISNFLDAEIATIKKATKENKPLHIKALEQELAAELTIGRKVKISGKADRIDSLGSTIRIIDYKTGKAEDKELKFDDWDMLEQDSNLAKSFQLLTYAYLYQKMNPSITDNITSGIITFRELSRGLKTVNISKSESLNVELLAEFENQLKKILINIFDENSAFTQTTEVSNCEYCSFKGICNR
jgi:ATP-dependent helicase/nuclease subunit B